MSTWNGIGTKIMGFTPRDEHGLQHGTEWVTVLYMPVYPLRRHRLITGPYEHVSNGGRSRETTWFRVVETMRPQAREVGATLLFRWVLLPVFAFLPLWGVYPLLRLVGVATDVAVFVAMIGLMVWMIAGPVLAFVLNDRRIDRASIAPAPTFGQPAP
jgi:hypothetical protein